MSEFLIILKLHWVKLLVISICVFIAVSCSYPVALISDSVHFRDLHMDIYKSLLRDERNYDILREKRPFLQNVSDDDVGLYVESLINDVDAYAIEIDAYKKAVKNDK